MSAPGTAVRCLPTPRVLMSAVRLGDGAPGRRSGNFYHVLSLVQALVRRDDVDLTVLTDEESHDEMASMLPAGRALRALLGGNVLRRDMAIAAAVHQVRPQIYHKPTGALPTAPLPCRTIAGIADLNFLSLPTRPDKRIYKELTHRWTAWRADHIVCASEFTRQEVISYLHPNPSRVSVIHHGANELTGQDDGLADRVGSDLGPFWIAFAHHAHKNVETILSAVATAAAHGMPLRLVAIGEGPYVTDVLRPMATGLGVAESVRFVGRVGSGSLRELYRRSEGLLFPSLFEGFGLPLLEAMACGTPVISSNVCSLPEVAEDAAVLIDPRDVRALLDGVRRLRGPEREHFTRLGRARAQLFTWDRAAAATAALYQEMAARADARRAS